ncbi:MAG: 50S ribosomal protein L25/general stress protein Ctc [Rhodospirillales bacterium]|nr:50S ribosomal protein L25/general stress protein Ctc [Rhodospirillales bacterium]
MSKAVTLAAEVRMRAGKGAARQTRREGRVPAVIYGNKQDTVMISLNPLDLMHQLRGPGFFGRVFEIDAAGEKHKVLARDLQLDPVTDRPIHVDFMRFGADTKLHVEVEVVFINEADSPGLKRGGVLNVVRHTIEMICAADKIPESVIIDLTGLDIGDSVHASVIKLPEGSELAISDRDFTIATIAAPTVMEEAAEAGEAAEAAEGVEAPAGVEEEEKAESEKKD